MFFFSSWMYSSYPAEEYWSPRVRWRVQVRPLRSWWLTPWSGPSWCVSNSRQSTASCEVGSTSKLNGHQHSFNLFGDRDNQIYIYIYIYIYYVYINVYIYINVYRLIQVMHRLREIYWEVLLFLLMVPSRWPMWIPVTKWARVATINMPQWYICDKIRLQWDMAGQRCFNGFWRVS